MQVKNYVKDIAFSGTLGKGDLALVRGVPGSGKSTFSREAVEESEGRLVHIEGDMYFEKEGTYAYDFNELARAHRWCLNTAKIMLNTRGHVLVSNTFTRFSEAKDYVDFAKQRGIRIWVISMSNEYGNIHGVPDDKMEVMRNRFETHETFCKKIHAYQPARTA